MRIQIFEPPTGGSTGGATVDRELVRLAADLGRLRRAGIDVERYGLSEQPGAFVSTEIVKEALASEGNGCLPLTIVDGEVVCRGRYPTRETLARLASLGGCPGALGPAQGLPAAPPQPQTSGNRCGPPVSGAAHEVPKSDKPGRC